MYSSEYTFLVHEGTLITLLLQSLKPSLTQSLKYGTIRNKLNKYKLFLNDREENVKKNESTRTSYQICFLNLILNRFTLYLISKYYHGICF